MKNSNKKIQIWSKHQQSKIKYLYLLYGKSRKKMVNLTSITET